MGEENASCRTGAREIGFDRHQGHLPVVDAIPREIEVEFPAEDIFALGATPTLRDVAHLCLRPVFVAPRLMGTDHSAALPLRSVDVTPGMIPDVDQRGDPARMSD